GGTEMINDVLLLVTQVGMLAFIVASMAAMGLGLTVSRIVEPLHDLRLIVLLLLANFVAVPLVAIATTRLLPMDESAATAIILIGTCAGAPFLPKLAQLARGDAALSVGLMVLLMVVTVIYAPIVVPLAVEGATVDAWDIASSLIVLMLIPLGIGLFIKARYEELADSWVGGAGQIANVGLLMGISASLLVSWRDILGAIGSWIFIGLAIVLVAALLFGWLAGFGRSTGDMTVSALATAQRNIAAAIVVAVSLSGDVVVLTMVGALVIPIVLIIIAGEVGKRVGAGEVEAGPAEAG
ncbi:MAG: bile acid:sodium symporter family protein, partial [Chloroflexota bacterium]|nr:bile acid:sodium symporter family protein [Chloroflexota bacterium]